MCYEKLYETPAFIKLNQYSARSTEWFMITYRIAYQALIDVVSAYHQLDGSVLDNHGIHMLLEN